MGKRKNQHLDGQTEESCHLTRGPGWGWGQEAADIQPLAGSFSVGNRVNNHWPLNAAVKQINLGST